MEGPWGCRGIISGLEGSSLGLMYTGTLMGTPNREPQEDSRNIIEI